MKTLKLLLILVCCAFSYNASKAAKPETGVWVSDNAELLLTDKIMIYFEKSGDDGVMAMVKVDSLAEDRCLFKADTILRGDIPSDFTITHLDSGDVLVNGDTLARAETIIFRQETKKKSLANLMSTMRRSGQMLAILRPMAKSIGHIHLTHLTK